MAQSGPSLTERVSIFMGAIFLFGLAFLFMINWVWPGILALAWLVSIPILLVEQRWLGLWVIAQTTIWLIGLPFLFAIGLIWPGILVLAGCSALLAAIAPPSQLDEINKRERMASRQKRKRTLSLPDHGYSNHHDDYEDDDWQLDPGYGAEADDRRLRSHRH